MLEGLSYKTVRIFLALLLMHASFAVSSEESRELLRFSYWDDATPPFVLEEQGVIQSGIIHDLAVEITNLLPVKAEFVKLPVARIEPQLKEGLIDIDCLTSPIWKEFSDEYDWSPVLFESYDRFMIRMESKSKIQSFSDLKGMSMGIYNGYVYHPEIMSMIRSGELETVKLHGVEHGIKLLKLGRIDTFVDFGLLLNYQLKTKNLAPQILLADFPADQYKLYCAYSKKMKVNPKVMDGAIHHIIQSGKLDEILMRYR